ncbi:MAG: methyltransferase, partial [Pseudomonadota bacterium]
GHVATVRHLPMGLDRFSQGLLAYLDGTRTRAAIAEALARDIAAGRLVLEKVSGDANAMKAAVRQNCDRLLSVFARHGVLLPRT